MRERADGSSTVSVVSDLTLSVSFPKLMDSCSITTFPYVILFIKTLDRTVETLKVAASL